MTGARRRWLRQPKKSRSVGNDDDKETAASAHKKSGYSLHCVDFGLVPGISEGTDTTWGLDVFLGRVKEEHGQHQSISLNWSPHFLFSRLLRFVSRLIRRTHWGTINPPVTFSIILRISALPFLSSRHRACLSSAHHSWNCIVQHSSVYLGRHRRFSGRLAPSSCEWG